MLIVMAVMVTVSLMLNVYQYALRRNRSGELKELNRRLAEQLERDDSGKLLLSTDESELKRLLVLLNRLLDDKQAVVAQFSKTERSMKKMLANFSHDLKTPLTVVLGYIEMLQGGHASEAGERERLLKLIHRKTLEMIRLMNGFFDLARLEAGDTNIAMSSIQVNEICKKSVLSFYELITANGLNAEIHIPEAPLFAWGNEEALERVLNNLLSNAIRHGVDGDMLGLRLNGDGKLLSIDIYDNGRGIREDKQELVFERLFTLDESRNQAFRSSGLGLAITKKLVEAMDGQITLTSVPYVQTTFTVRLNRQIS